MYGIPFRSTSDGQICVHARVEKSERDLAEKGDARNRTYDANAVLSSSVGASIARDVTNKLQCELQFWSSEFK